MSSNNALQQLTGAERQAVYHHRDRLTAERDFPVSLDDALSDWLEYHALTWRTHRQAEMLALQRQEIMRHKWIESEKARRDLGSEAVLDWIQRYAAQWREWYDNEGELKKA